MNTPYNPLREAFNNYLTQSLNDDLAKPWPESKIMSQQIRAEITTK